MKLKLTIFLFTVVPLAPALAGPERGIASVYSTDSGASTASGAALNSGALTAAHRSLPFGSRVRITNRRNGRAVVATINDRGPFVAGRIIDLTPAAARAVGISTVASVTVEVEFEGPLGGPARCQQGPGAHIRLVGPQPPASGFVKARTPSERVRI